MAYIIILVIGIFVGHIVTKGIIQAKHKPIGTIWIDKSEPDEGPYLFFEIYTDDGALTRLISQPTATVEIKRRDFVPRK